MSNHNPPTNGFDKRKQDINRNGHGMKDFAQFRAAAIKVANEEVKVGGTKMPVYEAILRQWAQSKEPRLQMAFIAYAIGKVPDDIKLSGDMNLVIEWGDNAANND
jgi:hypothetical protein